MNDQNSEFASRIVGEIRERELSPKPRWEFVAWNAVFISLAVVTVVLGALTLATSAHLLSERELLASGQRNALFTLRSLPYLWLAALIFLVCATYAVFKRTRRGYRFAPITVLGATILLSLGLGSALYAVGAGSRTHNFARTSLPAYERLVVAPDRFWQHPEAGFLAGVVTSASSSSAFTLDDSLGASWEVLVREGAEVEFEVAPGTYVRAIGVQVGPGRFEAAAVRRWQVQEATVLVPAR